MILFDQQNEDAISPTFESAGGKAVVVVRAETFTGMSVTIEAASSNDDFLGQFIPLNNGTFTAVGTVTLDYLPVGVLLRAQCQNTPGNANLFVEVLQ